MNKKKLGLISSGLSFGNKITEYQYIITRKG